MAKYKISFILFYKLPNIVIGFVLLLNFNIMYNGKSRKLRKLNWHATESISIIRIKFLSKENLLSKFKTNLNEVKICYINFSLRLAKEIELLI